MSSTEKTRNRRLGGLRSPLNSTFSFGKTAARLIATSVLAIGFVVANTQANAQTHATGLTASDPALAASLPTAHLRRGYVSDRVDLSPNMPAPGDQGKDGTCASWAAVYGAGSYYARFQQRNSNLLLSPAFVFNQVHHDSKQCAGSSLIEILLFMKDHGTASLDDFPQSRFCVDEDKTAQAATPVFHINDAVVLSMAPYDDEGKRKVDKAFDVDLVRQLLSDGYPVIVGMRTTEDLLDDLRAGDVIRRSMRAIRASIMAVTIRARRLRQWQASVQNDEFVGERLVG